MKFALENLKIENKEEKIRQALKKVGLEGKEPSTKISPFDGFIIPAISFARVDFP